VKKQRSCPVGRADRAESKVLTPDKGNSSKSDSKILMLKHLSVTQNLCVISEQVKFNPSGSIIKCSCPTRYDRSVILDGNHSELVANGNSKTSYGFEQNNNRQLTDVSL